MLANNLGILAIIASIINLIYCYYERVENFFWNFPAYGLIAYGLFLDRAYASSIMWIAQALISGYGFFVWTRDRKRSFGQMLISMFYDGHNTQTDYSVIATSSMSWQLHLYSWFGIVITAVMIYFSLLFFNDVSPVVDAISFAMLMIAAIQLNYKKIESWIYYVIADIFSIILAIKGHDWHNVCAILIFIILDLICFKRWILQKSSV